MGKGLRKRIHKSFPRLIIHEYNTSNKSCQCFQDLDKCYAKGKLIYRLFCCSNCVSLKNEYVVFRSRDKNSAISIMKLTKQWIDDRTRHPEFQRLPCATGVAIPSDSDSDSGSSSGSSSNSRKRARK